jgi:hypothetical protein
MPKNQCKDKSHILVSILFTPLQQSIVYMFNQIPSSFKRTELFAKLGMVLNNYFVWSFPHTRHGRFSKGFDTRTLAWKEEFQNPLYQTRLKSNLNNCIEFR